MTHLADLPKTRWDSENPGGSQPQRRMGSGGSNTPSTYPSRLRYVFEDFALDCDRRELRRGNELLSVEPQVFDLLQYLIRDRERVVSKDELIAAVWRGRIVSDATVSSRINAARSALRDSGEEQRLIRTMLRRGFRFVGAVREEHRTEATAVVERLQPSVGPPDRPSIAVLPFVNMSGDPQQDSLLDAMVEDVITRLSRIKWLFVIARNSSLAYRDRAADAKQVGRDLAVRYILEGSVRKVANRVRVTSQLVATEDGRELWAERYDCDLTDTFALQDEIAASVVAAIEPTLRRAETERVRPSGPDNVDAYDLVLRALLGVYARMPAGLAKAMPLVKAALSIEPTYALARGSTALAHETIQMRDGLHPHHHEESIRDPQPVGEHGAGDAMALAFVGFAIGVLAQGRKFAGATFEREFAQNASHEFASASGSTQDEDLLRNTIRRFDSRDHDEHAS